jgi:hypothetical protein
MAGVTGVVGSEVGLPDDEQAETALAQKDAQSVPRSSQELFAT